MLPPQAQRLLLFIIALMAAYPLNAQMRKITCPVSGQGGCAETGERFTVVYEYNCVDSQPHFPGGDIAMIQFINHERRYPSEAYDRGVQGRVLCGFVVNEDGSISNVEVMRGVEDSLNREAVRIISEMPDWKAGELDGRAVPVYCVLPIPFRL